MSNNKQQTAVEWYSDKLLNILGESVNNFTKEQTLANHYALKEAKEMEKEQIEKAYNDAIMKGRQEDGEQYYNETYGGNK